LDYKSPEFYYEYFDQRILLNLFSLYNL